MTELVLWAAVVLLALFAGKLTLPSPVELEWERFFKLAFVTRLRGEVEARDGDETEWLALGRAQLWYHPAARQAVDKFLRPADHIVQVPALDGERGLMEAISPLAAVADRLEQAYILSGADEVLYEDPDALGPAWQLSERLGPSGSWDAVALGSPELLELLNRRNGGTRWAVLGDGQQLAEGLRGWLDSSLVADFPAVDAASLQALVPDIADRLVVVAVGQAAAELVKVLHRETALRDRTRAVVSISADLGGDTAAWLANHFTHEAMDTEVARRTPYFHVAYVDPDADGLQDQGMSVEHSSWPTPPPPPTGRVAIEPIDLGLLPGPRAAARQDLLAHSLLLVVLARLVADG